MFKRLLKIIVLAYNYQLVQFVTSWFVVQKIYSKMDLVSCTNTHRDVTDLLNYGMVKNTKTWISWERNTIFLRNKKILNLRFRWHILRSYRFIAEVTFKDSFPVYNRRTCMHKQCYQSIGIRTFRDATPERFWLIIFSHFFLYIASESQHKLLTSPAFCFHARQLPTTENLIFSFRDKLSSFISF